MRLKLILLAAVAAPLTLGSATMSVVPAEAQSVSKQDLKQARKDATKLLKDAQKDFRRAEKNLEKARKRGEGVESAEADLRAAQEALANAEQQLRAAMTGQETGGGANAEAVSKPETDTNAAPSAAEAKSAEDAELRKRAERREQRREQQAAEDAKAADDAAIKAEAEAEAKTSTQVEATSEADAKATEEAADKQLIEDEQRRKRRAERRKRLREQEATSSGGANTAKPVEIIPQSEAVGTQLDREDTRQVERLRRKLREQRRQIRDLESASTENRDNVVRTTRDGREIIREDDQLVIRNRDDNERFLRRARDVVVEDLPRGRTRTTITRPDGTEIVTVKNRRGDIIYRFRRSPSGREVILIDNRNHDRDREPTINFRVDLPRLIVPIPRNEYVVELERADRRRLHDTLIAPPIERVERTYTLEEVRQSERLRDKVRRIDLDTVTFDTGSAEISPSQVQALAEIGYAMEEVVIENPDAVFLIEGHTDAIGDEFYNLDLSDRRAESIAIVLAENFDIPPENLITQGYGEEFLKIPTEAAERRNRRVTIRPISDLIKPS